MATRPPPRHWLSEQYGDFPWHRLNWERLLAWIGLPIGAWITLIAVFAGAIALVRSGW